MTDIEVRINGVVVHSNGETNEHTLGVATGSTFWEVADAVEALLVEIADTWPEVIRDGVL